MNEKLKKLVDELLNSGKDFNVQQDQNEIGMWLENYYLILDSNGKWRLE